MKRLFLLACLVPMTGWGQIPALVQCQKNEDTTAAAYTGFGVSITGSKGNAFFTCIRQGSNNTTTATMSDNTGQAWTATSNTPFVDPTATTRRAYAFYIPNSNAITLSTVTFSGSVSLVSMITCEVSGVALTNVVDTDTLKTQTTGTTFNSSSTVTSLNNEFVAQCLEVGGAVTNFAATSPFTIPTNGTLTRIEVQTNLFSTPQTFKSTTTWTTTQQSAGDVMVFRPQNAIVNQGKFTINQGKFSINGGKFSLKSL